jgi:hypothetical protein
MQVILGKTSKQRNFCLESHTYFMNTKDSDIDPFDELMFDSHEAMQPLVNSDKKILDVKEKPEIFWDTRNRIFTKNIPWF